MYVGHFFVGRGRVFYGSSKVNVQLDGLHFNPNDKNTLSVVKDKSTKWNVDASNLVDNSMFGVVTVYDNTFGYNEVFDNVSSELKKLYRSFKHSFEKKTHCEFCGQSIKYVAIIIAIDKSNPKNIQFRQLGCDCLGKIFGTRWSGYRDADSMKKELTKIAAVRSRRDKYAVKYKTYIDWLNSLPETVLVRKRFLFDMRNLLTTGERVFTHKMEDYLVSLRKSRDFSPEAMKTYERSVESVIQKLEYLLNLVKGIDKDNVTKSWSAYNFVDSILSQVKTNYRVPTLKQMNAINKVHDRYSKIVAKVAPKDSSSSTKTQLTSPPTDEMPW